MISKFDWQEGSHLTYDKNPEDTMESQAFPSLRMRAKNSNRGPETSDEIQKPIPPPTPASPKSNQSRQTSQNRITVSRTGPITPQAMPSSPRGMDSTPNTMAGKLTEKSGRAASSKGPGGTTQRRDKLSGGFEPSEEDRQDVVDILRNIEDISLVHPRSSIESAPGSPIKIKNTAVGTEEIPNSNRNQMPLKSPPRTFSLGITSRTAKQRPTGMSSRPEYVKQAPPLTAAKIDELMEFLPEILGGQMLPRIIINNALGKNKVVFIDPCKGVSQNAQNGVDLDSLKVEGESVHDIIKRFQQHMADLSSVTRTDHFHIPSTNLLSSFEYDYGGRNMENLQQQTSDKTAYWRQPSFPDHHLKSFPSNEVLTVRTGTQSQKRLLDSPLSKSMPYFQNSKRKLYEHLLQFYMFNQHQAAKGYHTPHSANPSLINQIMTGSAVSTTLKNHPSTGNPPTISPARGHPIQVTNNFEISPHVNNQPQTNNDLSSNSFYLGLDTQKIDATPGYQVMEADKNSTDNSAERMFNGLEHPWLIEPEEQQQHLERVYSSNAISPSRLSKVSREELAHFRSNQGRNRQQFSQIMQNTLELRPPSQKIKDQSGDGSRPTNDRPANRSSQQFTFIYQSEPTINQHRAPPSNNYRAPSQINNNVSQNDMHIENQGSDTQKVDPETLACESANMTSGGLSGLQATHPSQNVAFVNFLTQPQAQQIQRELSSIKASNEALSREINQLTNGSLVSQHHLRPMHNPTTNASGEKIDNYINTTAKSPVIQIRDLQSSMANSGNALMSQQGNQFSSTQGRISREMILKQGNLSALNSSLNYSPNFSNQSLGRIFPVGGHMHIDSQKGAPTPSDQQRQVLSAEPGKKRIHHKRRGAPKSIGRLGTTTFPSTQYARKSQKQQIHRAVGGERPSGAMNSTSPQTERSKETAHLEADQKLQVPQVEMKTGEKKNIDHIINKKGLFFKISNELGAAFRRREARKGFRQDRLETWMHCDSVRMSPHISVNFKQNRASPSLVGDGYKLDELLYKSLSQRKKKRKSPRASKISKVRIRSRPPETKASTNSNLNTSQYQDEFIQIRQEDRISSQLADLPITPKNADSRAQVSTTNPNPKRMSLHGFKPQQRSNQALPLSMTKHSDFTFTQCSPTSEGIDFQSQQDPSSTFTNWFRPSAPPKTPFSVMSKGGASQTFLPKPSMNKTTGNFFKEKKKIPWSRENSKRVVAFPIGTMTTQPPNPCRSHKEFQPNQTRVVEGSSEALSQKKGLNPASNHGYSKNASNFNSQLASRSFVDNRPQYKKAQQTLSSASALNHMTSTRAVSRGAPTQSSHLKSRDMMGSSQLLKRARIGGGGQTMLNSRAIVSSQQSWVARKSRQKLLFNTQLDPMVRLNQMSGSQ